MPTSRHPPLDGLVVDLCDRPVAEVRLDTQSPVVFVSAADFGADVGTRSYPGSVDRFQVGPAASWVHGLAGGAASASFASNCLAARSLLNVFCALSGLATAIARQSGRAPWSLVAESTWSPPQCPWSPAARSYRLWRSMFGSNEATATVRQDRISFEPIQSIGRHRSAPTADACC